MTGLSDDVYRSVLKSHSVDDRCIQTSRKIEYGFTVRFTTTEDVPYRQSLWFSLKLEQTQTSVHLSTIGGWWSRIVINRDVYQRGFQGVL